MSLPRCTGAASDGAGVTLLDKCREVALLKLRDAVVGNVEGDAMEAWDVLCSADVPSPDEVKASRKIRNQGGASLRCRAVLAMAYRDQGLTDVESLMLVEIRDIVDALLSASART